MKLQPVPKVGDKVRLTYDGISALFGSDRGLNHMRSKLMTITEVGNESMTDDVDTRIVQVSDKDINSFFLNHHMFEIVEDK